MAKGKLKTKGAWRLQPGILILPLWLAIGCCWLLFVFWAQGVGRLEGRLLVNSLLLLLVALAGAALFFFLWLRWRWRRGTVVTAQALDVRFREIAGRRGPRGSRVGSAGVGPGGGGRRRPQWGWDVLCEYTYRGREVREWLKLVRVRNRPQVREIAVDEIGGLNLRLLEVRCLGKTLWQAKIDLKDNPWLVPLLPAGSCKPSAANASAMAAPRAGRASGISKG